MRKALSIEKYDYFHLISDSCLLLKNQEYISNLFDSTNYNYIDFKDMPNNYRFKERYKCHHIFRKNQRCKIKVIKNLIKSIDKTFCFIQDIIGIDLTKKYKLTIKYGSEWFSITNECAEYVVSQESLVEKIFRYGCCTEEHFLQTIIYNSKLYKTVSKEGNLRFIDFNGQKNSPKFLTSNDYERLMNSNAIIGRKFSETIDIDIVKRIFENINKM